MWESFDFVTGATVVMVAEISEHTSIHFVVQEWKQKSLLLLCSFPMILHHKLSLSFAPNRASKCISDDNKSLLFYKILFNQVHMVWGNVKLVLTFA